jgi:D-xylose 1-dehydrogenase
MNRTGQYASYPSLRDCVVVVTGGASGIGQAFVEAFAMQKANVAFLDIDDGAGLKLTTKLTKAGATTPAYHHCDLTDIADVQRTIRKILQRFGTVDVLVNNAGNDTRHKTAEVTPKFWDKTIAVNLRHQFFMSQAVIPSMKKAQRGSIINMSSIGWLIPPQTRWSTLRQKQPWWG